MAGRKLTRPGESPTKQEEIVLDLHDKGKSVFEIAAILQVDPSSVYRVIDYWDGPLVEVITPQSEESTMAKKDKNKAERASTMADLREGKVKYGVEMDKVRGILGELNDDENEALIIHRQTANAEKVNIRLGEYVI